MQRLCRRRQARASPAGCWPTPVSYTHLGLVDATVGRIIFNNPVPQNLGYIDRTDPEHWLEYEVSFRVTKKTLPDIISRCMTRNGSRKCAKMLDAIKAQGYKYSTLSAISVAVCDAVIPPQKDELIADADKQVSQVSKLFNRGLISENERYAQTITRVYHPTRPSMPSMPSPTVK